MKIITLILIICMTGYQACLSQTSEMENIVKPGTLPEKLSGEFSFTEGPAADSRGNVYFTDQPNDRIMIRSTDGRISTFMHPAGRSNGLFFDRYGNLWACADEKNELWMISPDKTVKVILNRYNGKLLNGPNDLWIAPDGGVYFTDPFYRRTWWSHKEMPQDIQAVYYLSAGYRILKRVAEDLGQPNGIIGTPDGKKLYVADIKAKKTWSYTINEDGSLSDKNLFCEMGSDGMTIDKKGNVYLTGEGVTIFDRNGRKLGNIPVPEKWTANVCFGGKNRKSLFITASDGLYKLPTRMKGAY